MDLGTEFNFWKKLRYAQIVVLLGLSMVGFYHLFQTIQSGEVSPDLLYILMTFVLGFAGILIVISGSNAHETMINARAWMKTKVEEEALVFQQYHQQFSPFFFLSTAFIVWQLGHIIRLSYPGDGSWLLNTLSTLNSMCFLVEAASFIYKKRPEWLDNPFLKLFQPARNILVIGSGIAALGLLLQMLNFPQWAGLPDFLFSLPTMLILYLGLRQLFIDRFQRRVIQLTAKILLGLSFLLIFCAQIYSLMNFGWNEAEWWSGPLANALVIYSYQTALLMVFLTLAFSFILLLKENWWEYSTQKLDKEQHRNKRLRRELSHRIKNHLLTLSLRIHTELSKKEVKSEKMAVKSLSKIKVVVNALKVVYQELDIRQGDLEEFLLVKNYLIRLSEVLAMSFDYSAEQCKITINLNEKTEIRAADAKELGIILTELALNVDQHAYEATEDKFIIVTAECKDEFLILSVQDRGKGGYFDGKGNGLRIVEDIIETQFEGKIEYLFEGGTTVRILIPTVNVF